MINRDFSINGQNIVVKIDDDKSIKVGNIIFEKLEDFIYYVNKLTDIAEDLIEE